MTAFPGNGASSPAPRQEPALPLVTGVPQDHSTKQPILVGFPYVMYHHGELVSPVFTENPADYQGRHRFHVDPSLGVSLDDVTLAPLGADDRWVVDTDHEPKHYAAEVGR